MDIARPDLIQIRQRRRILIGVIAAVLVSVAAYGVSRLEPAAPQVDRQSVWIDTVKRGDLLREVRGPGQLVPKEIRWISADAASRVERVLVRPGAVVEADTLILELRNPEIDDQMLAARAAYEAAKADLQARKIQLQSQILDQKANLASVQADFEGAKLQAEAEAELNRRGIVSSLQYRQSQLRADQLGVRLDIERQRIDMLGNNLDAQMSAERARLDQLQSTYELRQRQAEALHVRAGMSGIVQIIAVEEGQQVIPGANLARVARPDVLRAELRVPETQAKDVKLDQFVRVDTRNGIVPGRVVRIDPAVLNGTVQVDVDLEGALPPGARPDLSVDGTIEIEKLSNVMFVGRPAFGQAETITTLFRLEPDGDAARRVPVQLGRASVSLIEVARGLEPGDRVILSDTTSYDQHDRLRLR
ncbi:MAG: HlyD family efflux transporter periplasmic adaptor subunit [Rhodanobacteraceae bacterium]|nr:HlyD family efflux transporter periplasmic adaptor subunit [Rhodanobacteraceae bacterium]